MPTDELILTVDEDLDAELAGLDALERGEVNVRPPSLAARIWSATWPKLAAIGMVLAVWQFLYWIEWKPSFVLPSPAAVFKELGNQIQQASFWHGVGVTMSRGLIGFTLAVILGSLVGVSIVSSQFLRRAVGALITGLQTMPSIAWFPLAILLFKLSEAAILFVLLLGAAPSVANGLVAGVDQVPPLLLRYGRSLRTSKLTVLRSIILPAAVPNFVGGLKQGWAFAWRSLMAGELIATVANRPSLGVRLSSARDFSDSELLIALLIVILILGILVDAAFTRVDLMVRRRYGLVDTHK